MEDDDEAGICGWCSEAVSVQESTTPQGGEHAGHCAGCGNLYCGAVCQQTDWIMGHYSECAAMGERDGDPAVLIEGDLAPCKACRMLHEHKAQSGLQQRFFGARCNKCHQGRGRRRRRRK